MHNALTAPSKDAFSPVVRETIEDFGSLMEEVLDFSSPDERGNWYYRGDTGTGKTTALQWHVADTRLARFVIAVPTQLAAEQMFSRLKDWGVDVAVWTQAHDRGNPSPAAFEPSGYFFKEQLADHRVVVGTHKFLLRSENKVEEIIGRRDLLIVDEVPAQFDGADDLQLTDFCRAWEESNALKAPVKEALRRVHLWAEDIAAAAEGRPQYHKPELSERKEEWLHIAEAVETLEATSDGRMAMRRVAKFVLSSFEGRAFVQLRDSGGQLRTMFCTTSMHLPSVNRAIHVSATVHLEGWQVSPYRDQVRECRGRTLDYSNLEIIADGWPRELPTNYADLLQSPQSLVAFRNAIVEAVLKVPADSRVLLVVPAKLMKHAETALSDLRLQLPGGPSDIRLTHFKVDVGSNEYMDCEDVILFGLHHAPKTSHIQRGLQFSQVDVSQQLLDEQCGPLTGLFRDIRSDDYKAQIKQLGARGRVRVANADGTCGKMRLWTYQNHVSPHDINKLFPGAVLRANPAAFRTRHGVRHDRRDMTEAVIEGLTNLAANVTEVTVHDLGEIIGTPSLRTRGTRLAERADVWETVGWTFIQGERGRNARPARFVRNDLGRTAHVA